MKKRALQKNKQGFTLIELSIVLVIIGLVAAAILAGQELIHEAELRATVTQIQAYKTATNTFRDKYHALPGDMLRADAVALGLCPNNGCPPADGVGLGDANGFITDDATPNTNGPTGETMAFWEQLSNAGFLDGKFGALLDANYSVLSDPTAKAYNYLPPSKLGNNNFWIVGSGSGSNYFYLAGVTNVAFSGGTLDLSAQSISPIDAMNIDTKLDDGLPNSGVLQARQGHPDGSEFGPLTSGNAALFVATGSGGDGFCITGPALNTDVIDTYAINGTQATTPGCNLLVNF